MQSFVSRFSTRKILGQNLKIFFYIDCVERALRFVLLMGVVSLLGDVVYEGARSVIGAYLATFGVTAVMLGFVIGLGELLSYGFRIFAGHIADKTGRYWALTFLGYAMIFSIPLIAFFDSYAVIFLLIILERLGKALRSPARDTLLSFATAKMGRGTGFGIHEALDQVGAVVGPLIFFFAIYLGLGYREGFLLLFIPAVFMLLTLNFAKLSYVSEEVHRGDKSSKKLERVFWLYIAFTILAVVGLVNFQLLAYHFKVKSVFSDELIPLLYVLAMGIDAISALLAGKAFDRVGLKCLALVPVLTPLSAFLSLQFNPVAGVLLFGFILGMHESVMRAGVAELSGAEKRATAYGLLNTSMGVGLFAGSFLIGFLYDISTEAVIVFSLVTSVAAFSLLLFTLAAMRTRRA
jgi:MFS family permease